MPARPPGQTIYFIRHGQTDWNATFRIQGQKDIPINANGRLQAAQNGDTLASLLDEPSRFRYIASPLGRTRETMNIVRRQLGLPLHGYETDDRIREISFGLWETYTFDELRMTVADEVEKRLADKWNFAAPQGESYAMLLERVKSWLPYVVEDSVVVCHGGVLRVLEHHLNGTPTRDVVNKEMPQDRIYKWDGVEAEWI